MAWPTICKKEIAEMLEDGGAASEWVDIVILAMDGLTRQLAYCTGTRGCPELVAYTACSMILDKQTRNEARSWPDWRTAPADKAIEHDRRPDAHERQQLVDSASKENEK